MRKECTESRATCSSSSSFFCSLQRGPSERPSGRPSERGLSLSLALSSSSFTSLPSDRRGGGNHFLGYSGAFHTWRGGRLSINTTIGRAPHWTSLRHSAVPHSGGGGGFRFTVSPARQRSLSSLPFFFSSALRSTSTLFGRSTLQRRVDGRNAGGQRKWPQHGGGGGRRRERGASPPTTLRLGRLHIATTTTTMTTTCTKGPLATGKGNNVFRHQIGGRRRRRKARRTRRPSARQRTATAPHTSFRT